MSRKPGQMKDGMDTLKIEGKTFYAWGEYRLWSAAAKGADRMRKNGHKARIIERKTCFQVFCNSRLGVMGQ